MVLYQRLGWSYLNVLGGLISTSWVVLHQRLGWSYINVLDGLSQRVRDDSCDCNDDDVVASDDADV